METDVRVRTWHIPQVPGKPFIVETTDHQQAFFLCETLAEYDAFQFNEGIKPDYCNANGVEYFDEDDQEWYSIDLEEIDDLLAEHP